MKKAQKCMHSQQNEQKKKYWVLFVCVCFGDGKIEKLRTNPIKVFSFFFSFSGKRIQRLEEKHLKKNRALSQRPFFCCSLSLQSLSFCVDIVLLLCVSQWRGIKSNQTHRIKCSSTFKRAKEEEMVNPSFDFDFDFFYF